MALLQISEPGQSPVPHQYKRAAGIDLGTTNSLVATVKNGGNAEVIEDASGSAVLPSVVHYAASGVDYVGQQALENASDDPFNTLASFKRFMGRGSDDVRSDIRYQFVAPAGQSDADDESGDIIRISTAAGAVTAIEASAEILKSLAARAESALGGYLDGAVITVPAYFDDAQRQATKDAATLAGLNVLRLVNEPTAAAIAYGLDKADDRYIAVYDLGGGTFDISILQLSEGVFEVLATGGNSALGGDDFDHLIADWVLKQAGVAAESLAPQQYRQLLDTSRSAKQALSEQKSVGLSLQAGDGDWVGELSLDTFNQLIGPLVEKTLLACTTSLDDAGLVISDIADIVLVGGSTRVPLVREQVATLFGQAAKSDVDPDKVVAIGASIQADILIGNDRDRDLLLLDVLPLSLGIETMGGLTEKIIHRNTAIPSSRGQEFTTYKDGQTALAVHVVQGERDLVADCRSLARFELRGIPPLVAGAARIRVTFSVNADGILDVSAEETSTGVVANIQVKPSYGLEEAQIANMLQASYSHASEDRDARKLVELQVDARGLIDAVEAALAQDADLLSAQEQTAINLSLDTLDNAIESADVQAIAETMDTLGHKTEAFAARRMNQSIQQALQGKSIDDLAAEEE